MRSQNDVRIYANGEVPEELKNLQLEEVRFPFGIKLIESDLATHWIPGTREDLLAAESKRLGREVTEIEGNCAMTMPPNCSAGGCAVPAFCAMFQNGNYYYCACQLP